MKYQTNNNKGELNPATTIMYITIKPFSITEQIIIEKLKTQQYKKPYDHKITKDNKNIQTNKILTLLTNTLKTITTI